jgi:hypothetical protein
MMFEYIGAAFRGLFRCVNGVAPPPRPPPPPMGGRPPSLPHPTKLANGVRACQPPVVGPKLVLPPRP